MPPDSRLEELELEKLVLRLLPKGVDMMLVVFEWFELEE